MAFPSNPSNGQVFNRFNRPYVYNSTVGVWRTAPTAAATQAPVGSSDPGWDINYMDSMVYEGDYVNLNTATGGSGTWVGFTFNNTGTILYSYDGQANIVYQTTLTLAWDITSALPSTTQSFSHAADNYDNGKDIHFKPDGTEWYALTYDTSTNIRVVQYSMSTPWDITTSSLTGVSPSLHTNIAGTVSSMSFMPSGTKVYIMHVGADTVGEWNLTTAWDITTLTYSGNSLVVTAYETAPNGMKMSDDGTSLFVVGSGSDEIIHYTLSTPYDLSTATFFQIDVSINPDFAVIGQLEFANSGKRMYLLESTIVGQYNLSSSFETHIRTNTTAMPPFFAGTTSPQGLYVTNDGTKVFVAADGDEVESFVMTTPHDISTLTHVASWTDTTNLAAASTPMDQLFFNTSGTVMYISKSAYLLQYNLSTAWDITTATLDIKSGVGFNGYYSLSADGTKGIRYDGSTNQYLYNLEMSTPGDIVRSSELFSRRSTRDIVGLNTTTAMEEMSFHPDGTKFYIIQNVDPTWYLHQYTMSTPWDVTTATKTGIYHLMGNLQATMNAFWITRGYLYVVHGYGSTAGAFQQYKISN